MTVLWERALLDIPLQRMDGWIFCVCSIFVFTVFTLLLLTGDCGGSDDYDCIPGSLLAQCFGASPPQDFPPLYFAASTWKCSYPGYTYQQNQHTIPGKTSRKEVEVLSMDVDSKLSGRLHIIQFGTCLTRNFLSSTKWCDFSTLSVVCVCVFWHMATIIKVISHM